MYGQYGHNSGDGFSMRGILSHLDLTVSDAARSVAFYDSVLGFLGYGQGEMDLSAEDHAIGGWGIRGEDGNLFSIALEPARGTNADRSHDRYAPGLHHIAFEAESRAEVDAAYELLKEIDATILDPPADYTGQEGYSDGYYAVFFSDPDGLKLEIVFLPKPVRA